MLNRVTGVKVSGENDGMDQKIWDILRIAYGFSKNSEECRLLFFDRRFPLVLAFLLNTRAIISTGNQETDKKYERRILVLLIFCHEILHVGFCFGELQWPFIVNDTTPEITIHRPPSHPYPPECTSARMPFS